MAIPLASPKSPLLPHVLPKFYLTTNFGRPVEGETKSFHHGYAEARVQYTLRRLHARSYNSPAQVPARVPDTFLPIERVAAKVVLCNPLYYGFLFWMDFGGVRTMFRFVHDHMMELDERQSEAELRTVIERKLEELRAEAERRDGKDDKLLRHA